MITNINEQFECVKHGKPGEQCGKQCILFNIDGNKFVMCKFFKLKSEYGIFKM